MLRCIIFIDGNIERRLNLSVANYVDRVRTNYVLLRFKHNDITITHFRKRSSLRIIMIMYIPDYIGSSNIPQFSAGKKNISLRQIGIIRFDI